MATKCLKIAVVGAGVSGLSTAIELLSLGYTVTIFRAKKAEITTSSTAAAFWYPFWVGADPDHSWYRPEWAFDTFRKLESLLHNDEAGITRASLVEFFPESLTEEKRNRVVASMWWRGLAPFDFRPIEMDANHPLFHEPDDSEWRLRRGIEFETLVINMRSYLPFLEKVMGSFPDVHIVEEEFSHLPSERLAKFDFVINCGGLRARELVSDTGVMTAIRGTVVRLVQSGEINKISLVHTGDTFDGYPLYVVPRGGSEPDIIVGGTVLEAVEGEDTQPRYTEWESASEKDKEQAERILRFNRRLVPAIDNCKRLGIAVGYRPKRKPGVRLEPDGEAANYIHNYGHGGGGVTLSWGCAKEVVAWIDRLTA